MSEDSDSDQEQSFDRDDEDVSIEGDGEDISEAESPDESAEKDEDQSADEDGEEEDDEGESDNEDSDGSDKSSEKSPQQSQKDMQDITTVALERTIFVGNLPSKLGHKDVAKIFKVCGPVESARIRSIVPEKEKLSQKVASITKRMHPKVDSVNAYVVFAKSDNDESLKKALAMNGTIIDDHRIRVDRAQQANAKRMTLTSRKKSVFVGNLRFDLRDDDLISHFQRVGSIDYVRLVRDKTTGMGKGFGFVKFMERAAVKKALELNDSEFKGRKLRVKKIDEKKKMTDGDKETASRKTKTAKQHRPEKKFHSDKSPRGNEDGKNLRKDCNRQDKNSKQSRPEAPTRSKRGDFDHHTKQRNFNKSNLKAPDSKQNKFHKAKRDDKPTAKTKRVKFDLKNVASNDQKKREGPRFNKVRVNKMTSKKTKTILKKKLKKEYLKK